MKLLCKAGETLEIQFEGESGQNLNAMVKVEFGTEFLKVFVHSANRCLDGRCATPVLKLRNKNYLEEALKARDELHKVNPPEEILEGDFIESLKAMGFTVITETELFNEPAEGFRPVTEADLEGLSDEAIATLTGLDKTIKPN